MELMRLNALSAILKVPIEKRSKGAQVLGIKLMREYLNYLTRCYKTWY